MSILCPALWRLMHQQPLRRLPGRLLSLPLCRRLGQLLGSPLRRLLGSPPVCSHGESLSSPPGSPLGEPVSGPVGESLSGPVAPLRRRQRRGVMVVTLLVIVVLLSLGASFLVLVQRDNRFAGVQEREERAWYLAQSGWEYCRCICGTRANLWRLATAEGNELGSVEDNSGAVSVAASSADAQPEVLLARVSLLNDYPGHYFEIARRHDDAIICRGIVVGSMSGATGQGNVIVRALEIPADAEELEVAYDCSLPSVR